jgi:murein DD-endopeptidase MepM/ murein hydrolase activator NlpD
VIGGLVLVAAVAAVIFWSHLEGSPPEVTWDHRPDYLGKAQEIKIKITDQGKGLGTLKLVLVQAGRSHTLVEKVYEPQSTWEVSGVASDELDVKLEPQKLGFKDGPAKLMLEVRDRSWREWFHGNVTSLEQPVVIDTVPPPLTLLGRSVYINRGGAAVAVYETDAEVASHGVRLGGRLYPGYAPWPQRPKARVCLFVYAHDLERNLKPELVAQDPAGNQTTRQLPITLRWKKFRQARLNISDHFLTEILPRFADKIPPGTEPPIEAFNWINSELRRRNNEEIYAAASQPEDKVYIDQAFLRQPGKRMAGYPDRRTYYYHDKAVGKAYHMGADVADVLGAPILAAAGGKVAHAGPLGIYGNAVILLHGLGVASVYGHLSEVSVSPGQVVAQGDSLGSSGATGLALGDHLHFGVLVNAMYTDPVEWWDPHWVNDSLLSRITQAGLPLPGQPAKAAGKAPQAPPATTKP